MRDAVEHVSVLAIGIRSEGEVEQRLLRREL